MARKSTKSTKKVMEDLDKIAGLVQEEDSLVVEDSPIDTIEAMNVIETVEPDDVMAEIAALELNVSDEEAAEIMAEVMADIASEETPESGTEFGKAKLSEELETLLAEDEPLSDVEQDRLSNLRAMASAKSEEAATTAAAVDTKARGWKSARIRELALTGMKVGDITRQISQEAGSSIRYQQVYQVVKRMEGESEEAEAE